MTPGPQQMVLIVPSVRAHQVDGKLDAIASYIFDARPSEVLNGGQICPDSLELFLAQRVREAEDWAARSGKTPQQHVALTGSPPEAPSLDRATAVGELRIQGSTAESWSNFSSTRANKALSAGKWQYEVHLQTAGVQQLGFATAAAAFSSEAGVGDCRDSYAFDGARVRKWSVACALPVAPLVCCGFGCFQQDQLPVMACGAACGGRLH